MAALAIAVALSLGQVCPLPCFSGHSPKALDETIYRLDGDTMGSLVRKWGWVYKGPWGSSGPSWVEPAQIQGVLVFLRGAHPGHPVPERIRVTMQSEVPKGLDAKRYIAEATKRVAPVHVGLFSETRFYMDTEIDLAKGMRPGELKRRLVNFAATVKPYATQVQK